MDDFNIDNEEKQNVIIEINKDVEDTLYDEDRVVSEENDTLVVTNNKKKKKKKNKKKFSWNNLTKKGKVKMNKAFRRHILNKKTTKRKRHLRKQAYCSKANAAVIKKLIPYK